MDKNYEANLNLDKLDEIGEGITDYVTDLNRDEINAFMEKIRDDLDKISENLDTQINESTKLADDIKDAWKAGVGGNKDEALTGIKRTVSRIPIVGRIVDHGHKSPSPRLKAALSVESEYLQNIKQTTNELKKIRTTLDSYLKGLEAKKKTLVAKETEIRLKLEKTKGTWSSLLKRQNYCTLSFYHTSGFSNCLAKIVGSVRFRKKFPAKQC